LAAISICSFFIMVICPVGYGFTSYSKCSNLLLLPPVGVVIVLPSLLRRLTTPDPVRDNIDFYHHNAALNLEVLLSISRLCGKVSRVRHMVPGRNPSPSVRCGLPTIQALWLNTAAFLRTDIVALLLS
jgi:hypothetical protein